MQPASEGKRRQLKAVKASKRQVTTGHPASLKSGSAEEKAYLHQQQGCQKYPPGDQALASLEWSGIYCSSGDLVGRAATATNKTLQ